MEGVSDDTIFCPTRYTCWDGGKNIDTIKRPLFASETFRTTSATEQIGCHSCAFTAASFPPKTANFYMFSPSTNLEAIVGGSDIVRHPASAITLFCGYHIHENYKKREEHILVYAIQ